MHLPMEPVSSQPLEKDTLFPTMDQKEVNRTLDEAVMRVSFAIE